MFSYSDGEGYDHHAYSLLPRPKLDYDVGYDAAVKGARVVVKAKPIKTPMPTNGHLDLDQGGKDVDHKVYRSMIGSLLDLCASRLDIMLSMCVCARFPANLKECHLMAVKRIFRYLVHTPNLGLWYPKGSTFELLGYSDSDYAGCKVTQKEYYQNLPIYWSIIDVLEL